MTSYQISTTPSVYAGYLPPNVSDFNKFLPIPSTQESPKLFGLLPFSSLFAYREFSLRARLSSISTKQMLTKQVLTGRLWGRLDSPSQPPSALTSHAVSLEHLFPLHFCFVWPPSRVRIGAAAARAKTSTPRPFPALKLGFIWEVVWWTLSSQGIRTLTR